MNLKKVFFALFLALLAFICFGAIYVLNEEKLYSEYWLQRNIDDLSVAETTNKVRNSLEIIKYKFYYDTSIDFSIELDNDGNLIVKRHSWFAENKELKVYYLTVDKNEFSRIKSAFNSNWDESLIKAEDYRFGRTYYVIEIKNNNHPEHDKRIAYYNVIPDKIFIDFKDKLIELTKTAIKNKRRDQR